MRIELRVTIFKACLYFLYLLSVESKYSVYIQVIAVPLCNDLADVYDASSVGPLVHEAGADVRD